MLRSSFVPGRISFLQQREGRVLLGFEYAPLIKEYLNQLGMVWQKCTLRKLYEVYRSSHPAANESEFFQWFEPTLTSDGLSSDFFRYDHIGNYKMRLRTYLLSGWMLPFRPPFPPLERIQ